MLYSAAAAGAGRGGRWEKRRPNTSSATRFFSVSMEPPAIIQPRHRLMQYSTKDSSLKPVPPRIWTASFAASKPAWLQASLATAVS